MACQHLNKVSTLFTATVPQYKLDLDAVGGDKAEIAKVFERHYTNFGGSYFVDCVLALKANHPLPSPPDRWNLADVNLLLLLFVGFGPVTYNGHVCLLAARVHRASLPVENKAMAVPARR